MSTKRVLEELTISELSAVDRPAQIHARMTILKRDVPADDDAAHLANQLAKAHARVQREKAAAANEKEETMTTTTSDIAFAKNWDAAVDHFIAKGQSRTAAMIAARKSRPDLLAKLQESVDSDSILKTQELAKVEKTNRDIQRTITAEVRKHVDAGMNSTAALRRVRADMPQLFAA